MKQYFLTQGKNISEEDLNNFIKNDNIQLPLEYKNFLLEVNGGVPKNELFDLREFDVNETNPNTYVIIDEFLNFDKLVVAWNYTKDEMHKHNLLPIADVRGGKILCCKQRPDRNAQIFFFDSDFGVIQLTDSLGGFLNLLISEEDADDEKYL